MNKIDGIYEEVREAIKEANAEMENIVIDE